MEHFPLWPRLRSEIYPELIFTRFDIFALDLEPIFDQAMLTCFSGPAGFSIEEDPGETLYFPTKILEEKGIGFTRFLQHSGELVILFPFSYYQCYNVGSNIVESMAYASDRWEVFPAANLVRQCGRSCFNGKQPPLVDLEFAKSISRNTPGLRPSIQEAIEQTRAHFLASGR